MNHIIPMCYLQTLQKHMLLTLTASHNIYSKQ